MLAIVNTPENCLEMHIPCPKIACMSIVHIYTSTAVYAFPFARPMIVPILLYLQHTSQDAIIHRT